MAAVSAPRRTHSDILPVNSPAILHEVSLRLCSDATEPPNISLAPARSLPVSTVPRTRFFMAVFFLEAIIPGRIQR